MDDASDLTLGGVVCGNPSTPLQEFLCCVITHQTLPVFCGNPFATHFINFSSLSEPLEDMDDASDLTLGGVVCGNPSKALRSRAKTRIHTPDSKQEHKDKLFAKVSSQSVPR